MNYCSTPIRILQLIIGISGALSVSNAQDKQKSEEPMFGQFEANAAYPYGRPNPDAPDELRQFQFMIGDNECVDHILQDDGSWQEIKAKWNGTYFLNGYGIQDKYWTDTSFVTSNIRIFDPIRRKWMVTFFSMPDYSSGVWEVVMEEQRLVMRQKRTGLDGTEALSRLTFYNITDHGFDWVAESIGDDGVVQDWKSSCKKVGR